MDYQVKCEGTDTIITSLWWQIFDFKTVRKTICEKSVWTNKGKDAVRVQTLENTLFDEKTIRVGYGL